MSMKSLQGRCTPGSRDECRTAPDGRRPLDQADRLEPLVRLQAPKKLHPPLPYIIPQMFRHHAICLVIPLCALLVGGSKEGRAS